MKKLLSLTIAVIMLMITLMSCQNGERPEEPTGDTPPTTDLVDDNSMTDDLPVIDFTGKEFRVHSQERNWYHGHWTADEDGDYDRVNEAIATRNDIIYGRFGVEITEQRSTKTTEVETLILSGDKTYQIYHCNSVESAQYAAKGYLLTIDELPYINTEKGYWDSELIDELTFKGMRFFAVGASDLTGYDYTHVLLFNKKLMTSLGLEMPYNLVKSKTWTLERFGEYVGMATSDLDGDLDFDEKDQWGYLAASKHVLPGFWIGAGLKSVDRDENGDIRFNVDSNQKFLKLMETVFQITYDKNTWFPNYATKNDDPTSSTIFRSGQGLFVDATFYDIPRYRNLETDFGIVPYPLYDSSQESYYARIEGLNLICVPSDTDDPEFVSIMLEAITSTSASAVLPEYYEAAIRLQGTRDEESYEMLGIIFEHRAMDLGGTVWGTTIQAGVLNPLFNDNNRNFISAIKGQKTTINATLRTFLKNIESLDF